MSFILDALKKSENERARQHGPALLEARVVPPRRGPPAWAIVVSVVLVANLALLAYVLLRPAGPVPAAAPVQVGAPATVPAPAPVAAPAAPPPAAAAPVPAPVAAAPTAGATATPSPEPVGPPPAAAVVNPADFAPARPPGSLPSRPSGAAPSTVGNGGAASMDPTLPTAGDLNARGAGVPDLNLALHVYDDAPSNRYVLINSQRLREGESTTDGVRVERITPEGALLSWRGQRFRLLPGE